MVILLLQMHRNFQRVEQYNMFPLLLLTPRCGPFCLYTLRLAYLCLDMHSVSPRWEGAEAAAGAGGAAEPRGWGLPCARDTWDRILSRCKAAERPGRRGQASSTPVEDRVCERKAGGERQIQRLLASQRFTFLPSPVQFLNQFNEIISDNIVLKTI